MLGTARRIAGGPFDSWDGIGVGICLEARSKLAGRATLCLDIKDYAPPTQAQFVAALLAILRAPPEMPVYVGCRAGIGRTGTILAGVAKLAGEADPIGFVRAGYHPEAVETPEQAQAVTLLDVSAVMRALAA